MRKNTSFGDTCNSGFCITGILSKPKRCACLVPKLPRNLLLTPAILWLGASGMTPLALSAEPFVLLTSGSFLLLCWSLPCLFTCPQWHGYCKVFVVFWFLLQGLLWNNMLASGLFPLFANWTGTLKTILTQAASWSQTRTIHTDVLLSVSLEFCLKYFWIIPIFQTLTRDGYFDCFFYLSHEANPITWVELTKPRSISFSKQVFWNRSI